MCSVSLSHVIGEPCLLLLADTAGEGQDDTSATNHWHQTVPASPGHMHTRITHTHTQSKPVTPTFNPSQ